MEQNENTLSVLKIAPGQHPQQVEMDSSQIVTMHIQSVDQNRAIKTVKRTITELDRSKIEEQKKAIRAGYDIDIIPSDLATYGRDAKALLKELQSQNERMFLVTFLVLNTGRTEQELENNVFQASSIAQKHNCNLCRLDYQQEQGLMSSLPLADCQIEIQRGLTTSSTAIFIPFTTQELYQSGKESLYYGLNALSNNLIMVDRKKLKNPNGLILGTPGSGKSFSAKREITNAFLVTDDDIIICDPEAEYAPLVERLHGQVIHIGPASTQYINPMDINSNYSEEDNPLALKADFILSLCELVVGGKEGLQPVEKTVIDRCVHVVYRKYFENPTPENMPLLEDLYNALLTQDEPEARHVAAALEIYVKGSLNIFNHHTNVDIHNRIVCFDIKQLGKQLKKLGMRELNRRGKTPDPEHYEVTYYADLPAMWQDVPNNEILEELFQMFNLSRPQDFEGHSLSVSDVIALKRNGEVSVHYVDSIGFKDLQGFLDKQPERPSVLMNLKEKCDAPECNPTVCRKARADHEL